MAQPIRLLFCRLARVAFATSLTALLSACASLPRPAPPDSRQASCERFFTELDRLAAEWGVKDAGTAPIPGFPGLRVDRLLASFATLDLEGDAYAAWIERLRRLDEAARLIELRNLPDRPATRIQVPFALGAAPAIGTCGRILADRELNSPTRRAYLLAHAKVPDAYSTWMRVLGLYPITRWAALEGVWRLHGELRQPFQTLAENSKVGGHWLHHAPPADPVGLRPPEIARILATSAANPLRIPEPSDAVLDRLFTAFAPIWRVETASDSDRIGLVRLDADGNPNIDAQVPVVYRLLSHARLGGRVLLQLNYLVWFPARPAEGSLDIYSGRFDGLIWRVTLGKNGEPLAYDSIHPCGCYYQVFPGAGFRIAQPMDGSEPILSPLPIPRLREGERLVIRLAARTHFIQGVAAEKPKATKIYGWRDYDELRSLPLPDGGHRSLFGPDGLLAGSERPERFLLWPLGVPSAGAMRQWGTHAIAFIGRHHFDEPWLLESFLRPVGK